MSDKSCRQFKAQHRAMKLLTKHRRNEQVKLCLYFMYRLNVELNKALVYYIICTPHSL